jgi:hypothetical protein
LAAEGKFLERPLKEALSEREEVLRDLVKAAHWVDRSAFGKESDSRTGSPGFAPSAGKREEICLSRLVFYNLIYNTYKNF